MPVPPYHRLAERLPTLALAAGLPLAVSFTWSADATAPKVAVLALGSGWLLLTARPGLIRLAGPLAPLLAAVAFSALVSGRTPPLVLALGVLLWLRARDQAARPGFLSRYLVLTTLVAAIVALNGVSQAVWNRLFTGVRLDNPFGERILSTLGNPTFLADYLAVHLPLAMGLWATARRPLAALGWGAAAAVVGTAIWLTGSKGGQASAVVAVTAWTTLALRSAAITPARLARLAVAGAAALAIAFFTTTSAVRAAARWTEAGERFSYSQRIGIALGAARLLAEQPLTGHGPGAFPVEFPRRQPAPLQRDLGLSLTVNHAHQDYLELACDLGLPGLGAFLLLLVFAWRAPPRSPWDDALRASLLAAATAMAFNFPLFLPSTAFFLWMHAGFLVRARSSPSRGAGTPVDRAVSLAAAALLFLAAGRSLMAAGWLTRGVAELEAGSPGDAARSLARVTTVAPRRRLAWQHLGRSRELAGDLEGALDAFSSARLLAPHHAITALNVGRIHEARYGRTRATDDLEAGLSAYTESVTINPYVLESRLRAGALALKGGVPGRASVFLDGAPAGMPVSPAWFRLRATRDAALGLNEEAAANERRAVDAEVAATARRIDAVLASGGVREALATAEELAARLPERPAARELLAYVRHAAGDLPGAAREYRAMASLDARSAVPHVNLATIAMQLGDLRTAGRHAREAVRLAPRTPEAHLVLGRWHRLEGRTAAAAASFRRALDLAPEHPEASSELARLESR